LEYEFDGGEREDQGVLVGTGRAGEESFGEGGEGERVEEDEGSAEA